MATNDLVDRNYTSRGEGYNPGPPHQRPDDAYGGGGYNPHGIKNLNNWAQNRQSLESGETTDGQMPSFSGDNKASDTWAWITRNQWNDYKNRFFGVEDELMNQTTYENPAIVGEEIEAGQQEGARAIETSGRMQDEMLKGYGISQNAQQKKVTDRMTSLGKSTAMVDAANTIRDRLVDRNRKIAMGSSNTASAISQEG